LNPRVILWAMTDNNVTIAEIAKAIRNIPDFPQPGIQFKDITPVLADPRLFAGSVDLLTGDLKPGEVDAVVGIDARGFIFAAAAAYKLQCGFVPVRKKGKLPHKTYEESYQLEYGSNTVAVHVDAVEPGSRVLLVDDLLATGGTAGAAAKHASVFCVSPRDARPVVPTRAGAPSQGSAQSDLLEIDGTTRHPPGPGDTLHLR